VMILLGLLAIAASVSLVYVLEIFRFKVRRTREIKRQDPATAEHEIVERVTRDIETGEFETVTPPDGDGRMGRHPAAGARKAQERGTGDYKTVGGG
jgi:hypothetical protein